MSSLGLTEYGVGKNVSTLNMIILVVVLVVAVVVLVMSIKNYHELDEIESDIQHHHPSTKEHMVDSMDNAYGTEDYASAPQYNEGGDYGYNANMVMDGADYANTYMGQESPDPSTCPEQPVPEPWKPYTSGDAYPVQAMNANYPDETSPHSLNAQTMDYGPGQGGQCAPDTNTSGPGDYLMDPETLLPGSWRKGGSNTSCPEGTDPNSQWTKYAPSREAYERYITASSSARLSVNTRNAINRITGTPVLLRSATFTPLSHSSYTFNDSSLRQDQIADATGIYPGEHRC